MVGLAAIVGQDLALSLLERARTSGKLAHAYLFDGPSGVGKKTTGLALAAALSCQGPAPGAASCVCPSCAKIAQGLHPDVMVLSPGGAGNVIAIEAIRDLLGRLGFPPHEGKARVVVLEDADRMTPQAQNAFLKTLEEPPARTHLVLTSSAPDRLLVTIRSRCQRVRFVPLGDDLVAELLAKGGVSTPVARQAARLAGGSLARAAELADGDKLTARWGRVAQAVQATSAPQLSHVIEAAARLCEDKEDLLPTLELMASFYRDAAVLAANPQASPIALPGYAEAAAQAASAGAGVLARRADLVLNAQTALLGFAAAASTTESLLLSLREVR